MKIGKLSALAAAAAVVSLPTFTGAEAMDIGMATVTAIDGVVLVSADGRFATATVGTALVRGSRILTMEGASTTVTYSDGCRLQLGGNTMAVLRDADECTDGSVRSEAVGAQYASLGMPTTVAPAGVASTMAAATEATMITNSASPCPRDSTTTSETAAVISSANSRS